MGTVTRLSTGREGISPGAAVAAYLATFPESKASTKRAYRLVLERFAGRFADAEDLAAIGPDDLAEWFTAEWGQRSAPRWNACRAALQSAYGYWALQEWVPDARAPLSRLLRRQVARGDDRALTRAEIEGLLTRKGTGLRERTFWTLLYESAARSSEVLGLDVADLDLPNRCARVRRKGGAMDTITWQSRTARLLPRLLKGRTSGPVFVTERRARVALPPADLDDRGRARLSYAMAEELFKNATAGKTLHTLRHSALTHAAEDGTNTAMMMAISGHTSVRSLARYARVSREALLRYRAETDPASRR
jgi:integrase